MMKSNKEIFEKACKYIPGGVSSPVRAFHQVGGTPIFVKKGKGCKIVDIEEKEYIDYIMSWGAIILGHSNKSVIKSVSKQIKIGTTYGISTEMEYILAKMISELVPSMEMVRFVNSGTEACMSAIRLARAFTGKEKIIKFEGCYHGHADYFLVSAGSGVASMTKPSSKGIPQNIIKDTIILPFNDKEAFIKTVEREKNISCVIIEPIPANMGVILPQEGFLETVANVCKDKNILLIFDEVITGFRFGPYACQSIFGIKSDLTCLGKIVGGGFPLACFGGKREIMSLLAPIGEVYQAGTLSANPVALSAGITTLSIIKKKDYSYLEKLSSILSENLKTILQKKLNNTGINVIVNRFKTIFSVFFSNKDKIVNFSDAVQSDKKYFSKFFNDLRKNGILIPPSQFESWFLSFSHSEKEINTTLQAIEKVEFT